MTRRAVGAGALLLVLVLAGCSGSDDAAPGPSSSKSSAGPSTGVPSGPSTAPAASPTAAPLPSATGSPSVGPPAPTVAPPASGRVPAPVERPGAPPPDQRLPAPPAPLDAPVRYTDGLSVAVVETVNGTVTETGAGAVTGQPKTVFTFEFTNDGSALVDLTQVVVTVTYGPRGTSAAPVYDDTLGDFAGELAPGTSLVARYAFSIPPEGQGDVTVSVDFDGQHLPGVFTGAVSG